MPYGCLSPKKQKALKGVISPPVEAEEGVGEKMTLPIACREGGYAFSDWVLPYPKSPLPL